MRWFCLFYLKRKGKGNSSARLLFMSLKKKKKNFSKNAFIYKNTYIYIKIMIQ